MGARRWAMIGIFGAGAALWIGIAGAQAQTSPPTHVALVIGNSAYAHTPPLRNPGNDAREMKRVFEDLGFAVPELVLNADQSEILRALDRFELRAAQAEVAVVFYSGHGMELGGENYLIP